jgi:hypothetical protein
MRTFSNGSNSGLSNKLSIQDRVKIKQQQTSLELDVERLFSMYGLEGALVSSGRLGFGSIEDGRPGVKVLVVWLDDTKSLVKLILAEPSCYQTSSD